MATNWILKVGFFAALSFGYAERAGAEYKSRKEFVTLAGKVTIGMSQRQVTELVGNPDEVRPADNDSVEAATVWCFGTDGPGSLPTLGRIYFGLDGLVIRVFGASGQPPDPQMFRAGQLEHLLRVIDGLPKCSGWEYDPLAMIRGVNAIQPLGKKRALLAIDEYVRICPESRNAEKVLLLLRVLFDVSTKGVRGPVYPGAPMPGRPPSWKAVPRFPIALEKDVPLLLVVGYRLEGAPLDAKHELRFVRQHGKIRIRPLAPPNEPLSAADDLVKSPKWLYTDKPGLGKHRYGQAMIRNQLLRLVQPVYRPTVTARESDLDIVSDVSHARWTGIVREFSRLEVRWDSARNCYVKRTRDAEPGATPISRDKKDR